MAAKVLETSSEGCQNIYYSIIKLLVQKLNSTAIAKKLKKYKKAFREYSKLRICECPAGAFGSCEDKEKVYVLKTEMKLNDSLEEFEKLQFEMNKVLGGKLLRLINVEEGCVQLTFRGFDEPELSLSKQNLQELRKIGVSGLSYYGDQVFDFSDSVPNPQQPAGITYVYVCSMHVYLYALVSTCGNSTACCLLNQEACCSLLLYLASLLPPPPPSPLQHTPGGSLFSNTKHPD